MRKLLEMFYKSNRITKILTIFVGIAILGLVVAFVYIWSTGYFKRNVDAVSSNGIEEKYEACKKEKDSCKSELTLANENLNNLSAGDDKVIVDAATKCSEKEYKQILSESVNYDGSISLRTYLENNAEPEESRFFIHAYKSLSGSDCVYEVTSYLKALVTAKISKDAHIGYLGIRIVQSDVKGDGSESRYFYVISEPSFGIYISDLSKENDLKVVSQPGELKWHGDVFVTDSSVSGMSNSFIIYVINMGGTGCESEESCKDFEKAVKDSGIQELKGIWIYDFISGKSKKVSTL